jgi:DnaJ-class molecular chaperone
MPNHYEVLGVNSDASEQEIRKSYRNLSLKYHPDRNSDPEAGIKFREINEANEILSDPQRRQQYDHELKFGNRTMEDELGDINNIINMMFGGGIPGMPGFGMGGIRINGMNMRGAPNIHVFHNGQQTMFDPFEQMFQQMQTPEPLVKNIQITFEQSYTGGNISIDVERFLISNNVRSTQIETVQITIPRGVQHNEVLIIKNKGNCIHDSKGDLKIVFEIINNTIFVRNGLDLYVKKNISLKESLCGFVMEIPHLNGKKISMNNITNHSIIKPGFKKVIPNLGMIKEDQYQMTGNLIIEFNIDFPESISPENIEILKNIL